MVDRIAQLEEIDCDLERRPAYTYAADEDQRSDIEQEFEVTREAGLEVEMVEDIDLPFPTHRRGQARQPDPVPARQVRAGLGARG